MRSLSRAIALAAIAVGFSFEARAAGFNGIFGGTGTSLMHKSGTVRACSEIFFELRQEGAQIRVLAGGYACEDLQAGYPSYSLEIRDGFLYEGKSRVGTFTGERLEIAYEDTEENFTYRLRLEIKDKGMSFLEEWTEAGAPALTVRGALSRL